MNSKVSGKGRWTHVISMNRIKQKMSSLCGRLFGYMLLLAVILVLSLLTMLFLLGQFASVRENYFKTMNLQMAVLDKEVSGHYENMVISATQLSQTAGKEMDRLLADHRLSFSMLRDNRELLAALQDALFEPLKNSLLQADVSGAFVLWDTTINSGIAEAQDNRSGLYIQLDTRNTKESTVIVFRGDTEVGKKHGAMPHRKWRLEYETSKIPDYARRLTEASLPLDTAHRISSVMEIPGTSEKAVMITVPIIGGDGTVYGLCGFELAQMYFKEYFSQPTTLGKLTGLFVPHANSQIDTKRALSFGVQNGYYFVPTESFVMRNYEHGLTRFVGANKEYVGISRKIKLAEDTEPSMLAVMVPKEDYDRETMRSTLVMLTTILLMVFFAVVACLFLSQRFIIPIRKGLNQFRDSAKDGFEGSSAGPNTGIREIDEIISFATDKIRNRPPDVVMPPYIEGMLNQFIEMTGSLTASEMKVLSLLIQGHDPKELASLLYISESTAKHHVLKIYKKLDVSSRGELLLYIEMLKGCGLVDRIAKSE